jgi:hypothetical protein
MKHNKTKYADIDLCVDKKIISVYKLGAAPPFIDPDTGEIVRNASYETLSVTYELILKNKSSSPINNLNIRDTLWGTALIGSDELDVTVQVTSCCETISIKSSDDIISSCGQLLNPCESYLDSYATCKILIALTFVAIADVFIEIPYVLNTIIITGNVNCLPILPIYVKSKTHKDTGTFVQVSNLPTNPCDFQLCIPYTNTQCNQTTCIKPRPT